MVHPADFHRDEVHALTPEGRVRIEHHLFAQALEKGVLLRARVRGVFLARDGDLQLAAEVYRAFAAAEPPLGT
jgi:hypothetical protein